MQILHVTAQKNWRGGENQICLLFAGLKESKFFGKYECDILIPASSDYKERFLGKARNIYGASFAGSLDVTSIFKIVKLILKHRYDVIHTHSSRTHLFALIAILVCQALTFGRSKRAKLVVHRRVEHRGRSWISTLKYSSIFVSRVIAVSKAVKKGLEESGVSTALIHDIPSSVQIRDFDQTAERTSARALTGFTPSETVFAFAGSLEPQKGIQDLTRAWLALLDRTECKNSAFLPRLLIAGIGPLKSEIEQFASENQSSVSYLGFISDMNSVLLATDVFVLPTHYEGLGSVLLDAAVCGCALVGSNVGGVPEIIVNQQTGLLVEVGSSESIETALFELLSHPKVRQELSQNAQKHVKKYFSVDSMVESTAKLYDELIH